MGDDEEEDGARGGREAWPTRRRATSDAARRYSDTPRGRHLLALALLVDRLHRIAFLQAVHDDALRDPDHRPVLEDDDANRGVHALDLARDLFRADARDSEAQQHGQHRSQYLLHDRDPSSR